MSGMTTGNSAHLIRSELWSSILKETLQDELQATKYVRMLSEFPDGNTFTIPSIGEALVDTYAEDQAVIYRPLDTGEFQFTITEYLSSATYVTKKNMQDAFYMSQLMSSFVPKQNRAIMEHFEKTTFEAPEAGISANSAETINGAAHRFAGGNSGKIEVADFAYARYALKKANVPDTGLVAIVDPSIEFEMNTLSALTAVSNNPKWEGIVSGGIATGTRFVANIYGFDVYTSNHLKTVTDGALNERDGSTAFNAGAVTSKANLFFSAAGDVTPLVGAWRQMPEVDSEYNKDMQREEYVTTARYGVKLFRPENMVTVVCNTAVA
jgi:hypothetical protein